MSKNKHSGSSFDSFLVEEGLYDEALILATKKAFVIQLEKALKASGRNKAYLRKKLKSPSTVERLFNDHVGISFETIAKTAQLLNYDLEVQLVKKKKATAA